MEHDDVNYHEDDDEDFDIDLSDYEVVEDEDGLDSCDCRNGCNYCLMLRM